MKSDIRQKFIAGNWRLYTTAAEARRAAGLHVILCVGEALEQREADQTEAVLDRQLIQRLAGVSADTSIHLSIAYEPVWAIGNLGHHATPQQAQDAHAVIRRRFGQMFDEKSAQTLTIQYGGSVKPENAAALLSRNGVDGALIGGASLKRRSVLGHRLGWPQSAANRREISVRKSHNSPRAAFRSTRGLRHSKDRKECPL